MSSARSAIGKAIYSRRRACGAIALIGAAAMCMSALSGCEARQQENASEYPSAIEQLAVHHERPDPLVEAQTRGGRVYEHYCKICHGPQAQGNGFNAAMLDPPPRNFADEEFWKQADDAHLLKVIAHGGQAGGKSKLMPSWGHTLDQQQMRDVVAYLRTVPEMARQAAAAEAAASSE